MKTLFIPLASVLIFTHVTAQDCKSTFTSYTKGASFETTRYDAKNTEKGKSTSTVTDVKNTADGKIITLHTIISDGSDKNETDVTMSCEGSTVKLDFSAVLKAASAMLGKGNYEAKFDKTYIEFPVNTKPGQTIPDDKMVTTIVDKASGTSLGTNTANFTNRKVVSKESVTTPAGTFDCYKVTTDMSTEMSMMGRTMPGQTMKIESYYSPSVGIVKSVTYNGQGNIVNTTVLTKVSK